MSTPVRDPYHVFKQSLAGPITWYSAVLTNPRCVVDFIDLLARLFWTLITKAYLVR